MSHEAFLRSTWLSRDMLTTRQILSPPQELCKNMTAIVTMDTLSCICLFDPVSMISVKCAHNLHCFFHFQHADAGDFTARRELRERLGCKSFKWYLENVYPEKFIPDENVVSYGYVSYILMKIVPYSLGDTCSAE